MRFAELVSVEKRGAMEGNLPKRYKIREVIKILERDGWVLLRQKGSHMQYAHPIKKGVVTVSFHSFNDDLHPKTLSSIFKQARIEK